MKSNVEALEDNRIKVTVEVDEAEFNAEIDAAFKRIAKEVRLPGFRPGKAPRRLLEAQFGHLVGREEALRSALPDYYAQAVVEHDVDVIAPPDIEITDGQESGSVAFDAVVEVRPSISIGGYNGLRVEIPNPAVSDDELAEEIDRLRTQFATFEPVDRAAGDDDHVTIDITGSVNGEEIPGLTTSDYAYQVGAGAVVAEIDENLRGAKAGDILEFDADHPDLDEDDELNFRLLVKEVKQAVLPDLDDDFVSENTEHETVDAMQDDLRTRMSAMKIMQSRMAQQQATAEALAGLVDEDVPEAMIDGEASARLREFVGRLQEQGVEVQEYIESMGSTAEEFAGQFREPADQAVRVDLALRAVAEAESIEIDDDAIDEELQRMVGDSGEDIAGYREQLTEFGQLSSLRADLSKRAAMEWLLENSELVDPDGEIIDRELLEFPTLDADGDQTEPADEAESDETEGEHK